MISRRDFLVQLPIIIVAPVLFSRCRYNNSSPTSPTLDSPAATIKIPQVTIDLNKVGKLVYSRRSPLSGSLYDATQSVGLAVGTVRFDRDRVTGAYLDGYAVVSVNGDPGPPMTNVLGEKTYCGWVVAVGNNHPFYDSIMDAAVHTGDQIDFYYGLPCSNPNFC